MKTFEYIFAAIVLVAILLAATFLTSISPQLYRSTSEIEQLKMTAQKVMTQLLLSPGDPEDWGGDISVRSSDLSSFGLAVSTVFTREAFVLDLDKVQRLNKDLPGDLYILPEKFSELLGLGSRGHLDYGVRVDFIPALKVDIRSRGSLVDVVVTSEQGLPITGANITLGALYVANGRIALSENRGSTDLNGNCTINLGNLNPRFLVAIASYHGLQVMNFTNVNSRTGYLIGNYLLVESGLQIDDASVIQVFIVFSGEGPKLRNVSCNISGKNVNIANYRVYEVSYIESSIVAVTALTSNGELLVVRKVVPESYSTIAGETYAPLVYMLERSVKIGLSTYTVRLKVWRMTW